MIQRNETIFNSFEKNYWRYYRELEDEFVSTRRYVDFSEGNKKTFSVEYLKLYQAVCSEIDVIGKSMAKIANSDFKPEDKKNNIQKWWYEIQDTFFITEGPFTPVNDSANIKRYSLNDYECCLNEEFEICPWKNYRIEKHKNKKGAEGYRLEGNAKTPQWWSDYNKVKHNRTSLIGDGTEEMNYSKANLENLSSAFAALYTLEKAFMDTIGTQENLESFADFSKLFVVIKKVTSKELDELFNSMK